MSEMGGLDNSYLLLTSICIHFIFFSVDNKLSKSDNKSAINGSESRLSNTKHKKSLSDKTFLSTGFKVNDDLY